MSYGARRAGKDWRHLAPPHHLHYFSRGSIRQALETSGLRIVRTQSQGVMWSAESRLERLQGIRWWVEEFVTHWRSRPLAEAFDLLDEITILAVRDL
jgi:hypothetical protein